MFFSYVELAPKQAGETVPYPFDFISKLQAGETINGQSCAATVFTGNDPSPQSIITGTTTVSGTVVTQPISGGVIGTVYDVQCTATTNQGNTYILEGYLAVIPPGGG